MNDRKYAKRVFSAIEQIDAELLYDARSYHAPKIKPYIRYMVAAVLVLAILSGVLVYTVTGTVHSYMTVDTDYGVTLELNASGTVVRATPCTPHYKEAAQSCSYQAADAASDTLICSMSEGGGLNSDANTVLFGYTEDSKTVVDPIAQQLVSDQVCVVSAKIGDEDAAQHLAQKRHITAGKAAYILLLSRAEKHMDENRLFRLGVNDIALLAVSKEVSDPEISVIGTPSDSGYLAPEKAKAIALSAEGVTTDRVVCELDSDGFRLIYTVMLYYGDRGAAYFITADEGVIRNVVYGSANTLERDVDEVREDYGAVSDRTPPTAMTPNSQIIAATQPADPASSATEAAVPVSPATDAPLAAPTVPQPTAPAIENPADAQQEAITPTDEYMSSHGWWTNFPLAGLDITFVNSEQWERDFTYDEVTNDIDAYLLMNEAQKMRYLRDGHGSASDFSVIGKDLSSDKAVLVVDIPESFSNRNLKTVHLFTFNDLLYVGIYEDDSMFDDTKLAIPRGSRRIFEIDKKALNGVSGLRVIELKHHYLIDSELEFIINERSGDYLYCDMWCNNASTAAATSHVVSLDNSGYAYDTTINTAGDAVTFYRYQRSAALLSSYEAFIRYRDENSRLRILDIPDPAFFEDNAVIAFTVSGDTSKLRFEFIEEGATLYVCYLDADLLSNRNVTLLMIGVSKAALKNIKRIVPVNTQLYNGNYYMTQTIAPYHNEIAQKQ